MDIESFIRSNRFPQDYKGVFLDEKGRELSPVEALAFLTTEKAKGRKVIPCSDECGNPCRHADKGCTGFDYAGGGCPGRYVERTDPSEAQ